MKKIISFLLFGVAILYGQTYANCANINFSIGNACISLAKNGNVYTPSISLPASFTNYAVSCDILLPNNELWSLGNCSKPFTYTATTPGPIKLYVRLNTEYKIREGQYDFLQGIFGAQTIPSIPSTPTTPSTPSIPTNPSPTQSLKQFSITLSPTQPRINEFISLTITALTQQNTRFTNYTGTATLTVEKQNTLGNRQLASNVDVFVDRTSIGFIIGDSGQRILPSTIKFLTNGNYRIKVVDLFNTLSTSYIAISFSNNQSTSTGNTTPSTTTGFTVKELQTIQTIYNIRDSLLTRVSNQYPRLRTDTQWRMESMKVKTQIRDIIDNYTHRTYQTYTDFRNGIAYWIYYTNQRK